MSLDASEENQIGENNNEEVYWWKTHKSSNLKVNFVEPFFFILIPSRRVFIVGQQSKENEICSFTLFFLIFLPLSFDFIYKLRAIFLASRPRLVSAGGMCPNRS